MTDATLHKEVWMTGSGGFIGRCTRRALAEAGADVRCFTNRADAIASAPGMAPRLLLDFASESAIRRAVDQYGAPDTFVHLAWGAMTDPGSDEHLAVNAPAGRCLIDTLFDAGLRTFVFIGSANEYGAREGELQEDLPPMGRLTNYAKAKTVVAAHGLARAQALNRVFVAVRPFYVYGPGQRAGSLINKLHAYRREGRPADLGPCEHFRDYVYVDDVAEGIRRLCAVRESATVNIGSGTCVRVRDLVTGLWTAFGGRPEDLLFGAHAMRAGEPEQLRCWASQKRLRALTGWAPAVMLAEGLRLTARALEARPS
jgi:dTDP-6-deoxy-L-talose 4-dehydrogenase (NAD+)